MLSEEETRDLQAVRLALKEFFARYMNVSKDQFNDEDSFFSLGLTSLIHAEILDGLAQSFPGLPSTVLFEHPNFEMLSQYLQARGPLPQDLGTMPADQGGAR